MSTVKLDWTSQGDGVTYNVYRSTALIDSRELPEIHATVTANELTDTDLVFGNAYYYVIETMNGDEQVSISRNKVVTCLENSYVAANGNFIKVDSFGNEVWRKSYAGQAIVMQSDNVGNIYLGTSQGVVTKFDYMGDVLWTETLGDSVIDLVALPNRVHVLINDSGGMTTYGHGIKVLNFSSGLITDEIETAPKPLSATTIDDESVVLFEDGEIIVYNQSGTELRSRNLSIGTNAKIHASPDNIILSENGSTISFMEKDTLLKTEDIITRNNTAFTALPDKSVYIIETGVERNIRQIKVDRYNGWGMTVDGATMIDVDKSGNVIVASTSSFSKFNSKGIKLWDMSFTGIEAICTEPSTYWM